MKPLFRPAALLLALLLLLPLSGCAGRVTQRDIQQLQTAVDELRLQNHELSLRLAALEQAAADSAAAQEAAAQGMAPAPAATATPAPAGPYTLAADEICSLLLKNGMPVRTFYRYTESSDPDGLLGTQNGYTSRADFQDSEVEGVLGVVEVFTDTAMATLRSTTLQNAAKSGSIPAEAHRQFDNVLLRFPAAFSEEKLAAYEAAVQQVLGIG